MISDRLGAKKNEDLESFVKSFSQEMYEKYNLKIDKDDPIVIEIALLFKFCDKISSEFNLVIASQSQKNEMIASEWKKKEDEFFKVFFAEMQSQTLKFKELTYEVFVDQLKEAYQDITKNHLVRIKQLNEAYLKRIRFQHTVGFVFQFLTVSGVIFLLKYLGLW